MKYFMKNTNRKNKIVIGCGAAILSLAIWIAPAVVFGVTIENPLGSTGSVEGLIEKIIDALMLLAGSVAAMAIVYGAFTLLTSAGESEKVESAKKTITYAIIGLVIIALAKPIINFVIGALQ